MVAFNLEQGPKNTISPGFVTLNKSKIVLQPANAGKYYNPVSPGLISGYGVVHKVRDHMPKCVSNFKLNLNLQTLNCIWNNISSHH